MRLIRPSRRKKPVAHHPQLHAYLMSGILICSPDLLVQSKWNFLSQFVTASLADRYIDWIGNINRVVFFSDEQCGKKEDCVDCVWPLFPI